MHNHKMKSYLGSLITFLVIFLTAGGLFVGTALAQEDAQKPQQSSEQELVYIVKIDETIDNALAEYINRALADAVEANATAVIFDIDTFGGLVDAADEIRKAILDAPMLTIAFIDKNAASAGALISYANDKIYMVPGASIGAATVVEGGTGEKAPDKYQSYMRGLMRATAEANGRDPHIAESMVDESVVVEGLIDDSKVLTLSSSEAVDHKVADGILENLAAVLEQESLGNAELVMHEASKTEQLLRFLGSPVVAGVLMMMMMTGLYFELQSPGVGFAGGAALVGAMLFFAPHYMLGLVESWEIAVFGIGILLLLAEVFVIPGFGIAGVAGFACVISALVAGLVGNVGFNFPAGGQVMSALMTVVYSLFGTVTAGIVLAQYFIKMQHTNPLVLQASLHTGGSDVGYQHHEDLVGETGIALTILRPSGAVEINGQRLDVVTTGGFVEAGAPVKVVSDHRGRIKVQKLESLNA